MSVALEYRPLKWSEVIGQQHVVRVLEKAIEIGRVPAALLLSGTRGTGKTTIARILAKALNCTAEEKPCNLCERCKAISKGTFAWVKEVDAASNRGIDDVRKIIEQCQFKPPSDVRFVWILDECHQLTEEAFNAMLKLLEESYSWVNFILCTTEEHKLLETVRSRCMRFQFRHLSFDELRLSLVRVLKAKSVKYTEEAVELLAVAANGSIRDGLTLLDPCLVLEELTVETVRDLLGLLDSGKIADLFDSILDEDATDVLRQLKKMLDESSDSGYVFDQIGKYIYDLQHVAYACDAILKGVHSVLPRLQGQVNKLGMKGIRFLLRFWADRLKIRDQSMFSVEIFCLLLSHELSSILIKLTREIVSEFVGEESVEVLRVEEQIATIRVKEKSIDIVVNDLDAKTDYYIRAVDMISAVKLGKTIKDIRIRKREDASKAC